MVRSEHRTPTLITWRHSPLSWECDRDLTISATWLLQLLWEQVNICLGQALSGYNLERHIAANRVGAQ